MRNAEKANGRPPAAETVVVFAKLPEAGTAKTRIAAGEGREGADAVYAELLAATAHSVASLPHYVAYADGEGPGELRRLFPKAAGFIPQEGGTLGARLRNVFLRLYAGGAERICAIGCDCPYLDAAGIREAFGHLAAGAQVVMGPAEDGGYYLVGCSREGLPVFSATLWGTRHLLDETLRIVEEHGLSCSLLATLSDIDTMKDYRRWKEHGG